uniref:Anaphase-promoting complex subunit 5 n=1 Tax=Lepeophtheirus salmonis TaxID=72036 RepID=A0A0K2VFI6_LEPSM
MPGGRSDHREGGDVSLTDPSSTNPAGLNGILETRKGKDWKRVTPAKLCIALLIRNYEHELRSELTTTQRSSVALTILKLIQSSEFSCSTLILKNTLQSLPKGLANEWRRSLALTVADGVGGLIDLKISLENALSDSNANALHRSSVVGIFFKKLILYFESLTFSEVSHLFENFKLYYNKGMEIGGQEPSQLLPENEDPDEESIEEEVNNKTTELSEENEGEESLQSELYIARQVELLSSVEYKADPPRVMQEKISQILKEDPTLLPPAYFLTYLNCLRSKEYAGSIQALHMAFAPDLKCPSSSEDINKEFRYSALNLSALHSRFQHKEEALKALREAITLAQDANDHVCLQHALSWMYRIRKNVDKEKMIRRCVTKSGELNLSYLVSLGIQSLSQLYHHKSIPPSTVMEVLTKSDVLNCQHSIIELITSSYAQKSAFWTLYGKTRMSFTVSILLLNLDTSDPTREGLYVMSESYVLALCNVARYLHDHGHGKAADKVIDLAKSYFKNFTSPLRLIWHSTQLNIQFQRYLHRTNWVAAENLIYELSTVDAIEPLFLQLQLYIEKGDPEMALDKRDEIIELIKIVELTPSDEVRFLVHQAELCCLVESFSSAISPLTNALTFCKKYHMELMESIVCLHLAHVQLQLGMPIKSLEAAEENLPTILSHGTLYDSSRAYLLIAKARVACSPPSSESRKDDLLKAIDALRHALIGFKKMQCFQRMKDVYYMMARLHHALNQVQERNQASAEFKLIGETESTNLSSKLAIML